MQQEQSLSYYEAHKEARKQFQKQYYAMNKDKIKEYYSKEEIKAKKAEYMRQYRTRKRLVAA